MQRTCLLPCLALLSCMVPACTFLESRPNMVPSLPTEPANTHYVANRSPLLPSPLVKLPIGAIEPRGWLRKQLELEADGFSGHLTEISAFLKKDDNAWLTSDGLGQNGWEEVPYWLKGFGDLGYVLGDRRIIDETRGWIEGTLASPRADGYFGPRDNLTRLNGKPDLWPHMIMLNVLQSYYEHTSDPRVLELMTKYFRWELSVPAEDFLLPFWQQQRAADNLASVYWLYDRTGAPWLLDLADRIHRRTANWTAGVANWHGVNIAQAFRGPAVYYQQSHDATHLQATENDYQEVMQNYGLVPGGMFGADENARPGYTDPRQGAETCTMAEFMLSFEMLLKITGAGQWADRCEEVAFNSLPASMTADLKALRYLTAPNLIRSDRGDKSQGFENGGPMLLYNPHDHRCCQHNVAHAWPYFAEHLWMATAGNGLAAVLYAPCQVTAKVGDGTEVTITEETQYPFREEIEFTIATPQAVQFALYLRMPGWCFSPLVTINDKTQHLPFDLNGYLRFERTWSDGDRVRLQLPMPIGTRTWLDNHNSVSVIRGPLIYSLKIGEQYVRAGGTDAWPAFEVHPATPWNYGLVMDKEKNAGPFEVVVKDWPASGQPFEAESAPIELKAQARRIPGWQEDQFGLVGLLKASPARTAEPIETVTLIPMGCARLRISSFPTVSDGPEAYWWVPPSGR